jgi:FAD/FMN-containing dehydrogenase
VTELLHALNAALGADQISTDTQTLKLLGQDLFAPGPVRPVAIVAPQSVASLAAAVAAVASNGGVIAPRGGGLSYSSGYLPEHGQMVVVDTRRLNRIIEINESDRYVRVEAGVTWQALDAALAKAELRTPFWGTGSGLHATVGATLSQHAMNYGSGQFGPSPASVLGLEVVVADGSRLHTGSGAGSNDSSPFFRHYGPDLTGLFLGDCGALGVKARATLQLLPRPGHIRYGAYEYPAREPFARALCALGRGQLAAEIFGFDPRFMASRSTYEGVTGALKTLGSVAKAEQSFVGGVKAAARVARAGAAFLDELGYSIHFTVEGQNEAEAEARHAAVDALLAGEGHPIEASVGRVMRAVPFPDPTMLIARTGKRWIPLHGIVPHSKFAATLDAVDRYMARQADVLERHDIEWATTMVPAGPSGVLIEPNLYWPDSRSSLLESYLPDSYLDGCQTFADNPSARAAVAELRGGLTDVFTQLGAAHFQIGRFYPYLATRRPETRALLQALKAHLDPAGIMNPGVLGLG